MPDEQNVEVPGLATDPALSLPPDPHRLPPPSAWFAPDAARHFLDRPRFCPNCGHSLIENLHGFFSEYWRAEDRVYFTWCWECEWTGEIVKVDQVFITEKE